ncbi:MAG: hypothetical protein KGJ13_08395 [Patescibacteria group bacterium]|nr:hypothetical protein [Patescibacteria group bacterium]
MSINEFAKLNGLRPVRTEDGITFFEDMDYSRMLSDAYGMLRDASDLAEEIDAKRPDEVPA